jgi:hypothetical protein
MTTPLHQLVFEAIKAAPEGLTCDAVEALLNRPHQAVSARVYDLVKAGLIYDTKVRRHTRSKKWARVYRSKP